MTTASFRPGFRISRMDIAVLVLGAIGAVAAWSYSPELAILGSAAVLHFFLFCNVFRVARRPELFWAAVFLACVFVRVSWNAPWLAVAAAVAITTVAVIWRETRKPSYHGVLWRRFNPDLPAWWSQHRG